MSRNDTTVLLLCAVALTPIVAYLVYVLLVRLQMYLIEFFVTLVMASVPLGISQALLDRTPEVNAEDNPTLKAILLAAFPAIFLFSGSVWGMSAIKRLGEQRAWHRLGMIAAGWGIVVGFVSALVGAIVIPLSNSTEWTSVLIWSGLASACVPGLTIELRCRKRAAQSTR
ncbi:MAG: hypothetical protein KIS92_22155 [Planctomycetota bacterium]|nr:hypothetical protein [Planctomycetota bacterium]